MPDQLSPARRAVVDAIAAPPLREILRLDRQLRSADCRPCLLLGEAPNRATERRPELWLLPDDSGAPHTANRLCMLAELSVADYLRTFDRDNLVHRASFGSPTRYRVAGRHRAPEVLDRAERRSQRVLVLGKLPASCLTWVDLIDAGGLATSRQVVDHRDLVPCRWYLAAAASLALVQDALVNQAPIPGPYAPACYVPHPSGRNRWHNDPDNQRLLRELVAPLVP